MHKTCLKCGHVNPKPTGAELEPCPQCGAIYSRVEAAMTSRQGAATAPSPSRPARAAAPVAAPVAPWRRARHAQNFLGELRERSNYPTFRAVVRFVEIASYVVAALVAVVSGLAIKNDQIVLGVGFLLAAFYGAIMARFAKEAFFMLADGVDSLVHIASSDTDRRPGRT